MVKMHKELSLSDMAYEYLVERIVNRGYPPGMKLSEREIASSLNISRVPVREALRKLEYEGWVVTGPNKRMHIRRFTEKDVYEIYQIREGIEGIASREAARNASSAQMVRLAREVKILKNHDDDKSHLSDTSTQNMYRKADMYFHKLIVEASGNGRLEKIFSSVVLQSQCFFFVKEALATLGTDLSNFQVLVPHQDIYDAIAARNGDEAEQLMRKHLRTGCEIIVKIKNILGIS